MATKPNDFPQFSLDFLGTTEKEDSKAVSLSNLPHDVLAFFKKTYPGKSGAARCAFVAAAVNAYVESKGGYISPDGSVLPLPRPEKVEPA